VARGRVGLTGARAGNYNNFCSNGNRATKNSSCTHFDDTCPGTTRREPSPVGGKRADLNLLANNAEVEQVLMRTTPNPHDAHLEHEHAWRLRPAFDQPGGDKHPLQQSRCSAWRCCAMQCEANCGSFRRDGLSERTCLVCEKAEEERKLPSSPPCNRRLISPRHEALISAS